MLTRIFSRSRPLSHFSRYRYFANNSKNHNNSKIPVMDQRGKLLIPMKISLPDLGSILGMPEEILGLVASDVTQGGIPRNKWKNTILEKKQIELICAVAEANYDFKCENKERRPPIITIMGHVDHGKTTLVDALRHSNLTQKEYGEVTQSIGAFSLLTKENKHMITIIDTPGHEVFVKMRSRGVLATDIIILVVSAAEGVQRQTLEVIKLAKDSGVPMIVALNKIDRPDADKDRTLLELAENDVVVPELGGDIPWVSVSARKETNIDKLIEAISKKANTLDLDECNNIRAQGFVIESEIMKNEKFASVASSILIMRGLLTNESHFVCDQTTGRVRYIRDDTNTFVKRIGAGKAAHIGGFKEIPAPGTLLHAVENDKQANMVLFVKKKIKEKMRGSTRLISPEGAQDVSLIEDEMHRAMPIIIKVSRAGILETIMDEMRSKIRKGKLYILTTGIGLISESDIKMAADVKGVIFGFETDCRENAADAAAGQGVPIRIHRLLFNLIENLENLENEVERRQGKTHRMIVLGKAMIQKIFTISGNALTVGGSKILSGKINNKRKCRILRKGTVIKDGLKISGLKKFAENVDEAEEGNECGITFEDFSDLAKGDVIESYIEVEIQPSFSFKGGVEYSD